MDRRSRRNKEREQQQEPHAPSIDTLRRMRITSKTTYKLVRPVSDGDDSGAANSNSEAAMTGSVHSKRSSGGEEGGGGAAEQGGGGGGGGIELVNTHSFFGSLLLLK